MADGNGTESQSAKESDDSFSSLSHAEIKEVFQKEIRELLRDSLLRDIPQEPTEEEVKLRIALEKGQAMVINVKRHGEEEEVLPILIEQDATVLQLKSSIQRYLTLKLKREGGPLHISWRYVWKTYWLFHNGEKLTDDKKTIKEYGIRDQSQVTFIKRLRRK